VNRVSCCAVFQPTCLDVFGLSSLVCDWDSLCVYLTVIELSTGQDQTKPTSRTSTPK